MTARLHVHIKHHDLFVPAQSRWILPGGNAADLPVAFDITALTELPHRTLTVYLTLYAYAQNTVLLQPTSTSLWRAVLGVRSDLFQSQLDLLEEADLIRRTYVSGRHLIWVYPPGTTDLPPRLPKHTRISNVTPVFGTPQNTSEQVSIWHSAPPNRRSVHGAEGTGLFPMPVPLTSVAIRISADGVTVTEHKARKRIKASGTVIAASPGTRAGPLATAADVDKRLTARVRQVRAAACPQALRAADDTLLPDAESCSDPPENVAEKRQVQYNTSYYKKDFPSLNPDDTKQKTFFEVESEKLIKPGSLRSPGLINFSAPEPAAPAPVPSIWFVERRFRGASVPQFQGDTLPHVLHLEKYMPDDILGRLNEAVPAMHVVLRPSNHKPRKRVRYPEEVEQRAKIAWDHFRDRYYSLYQHAFPGMWHVHRRVFAKLADDTEPAVLAAIIDVFCARARRDEFPAVRKYGHTPQTLSAVLPSLAANFRDLILQRADAYRAGTGPATPVAADLRAATAIAS